MVDLIGIEPTTLRMRTVRSRKVVSFLPTDCGVWFDENDLRESILCNFPVFQRLCLFTVDQSGQLYFDLGNIM